MTDKAEQGDQVVSLDEILRDQKVTNIPTYLGPELGEHIPMEPVEESQGTTVVHQGLSFFHNTQHGEHPLSFPGASTQRRSDI